MELLSQYKDGLVCMSACAGGIVAADLVNGNFDKQNKARISRNCL